MKIDRFEKSLNFKFWYAKNFLHLNNFSHSIYWEKSSSKDFSKRTQQNQGENLDIDRHLNDFRMERLFWILILYGKNVGLNLEWSHLLNTQLRPPSIRISKLEN